MRRLSASLALVLAAILYAPTTASAAAHEDPQRTFATMIAMCSVEPAGCAPRLAPRAIAPKVSRGTPRSTTVAASDVWGALARCESGGDPLSRSAGGRYTGAFQFADATWRSLGYSGSAADHPYAAQLEGAQRLQARSGWGQWPRCARRLGLL